MRTCVRDLGGHPGARLQRALAVGNLTAAKQAAFEVAFVPLAQARALGQRRVPAPTPVAVPDTVGRRDPSPETRPTGRLASTAQSAVPVMRVEPAATGFTGLQHTQSPVSSGDNTGERKVDCGGSRPFVRPKGLRERHAPGGVSLSRIERESAQAPACGGVAAFTPHEGGHPPLCRSGALRGPSRVPR